MKKLLCLVLALVLAMSMFAGCGKKGDEGADTPKTEESGTPAENNETGETPAESSETPAEGEKAPEAEPEYELPEPSTNTEVVTAEEAPDVYLAFESDNHKVSISYHLKDCKLLEGENAQKMPWEAIQTLGHHQCPECNPPRYEGYAE